MPKLLDNKQIIHIVVEIVIILGIFFYFSQKNKKLMKHINDLTQRLEEQEDIIQKHEQMINKLAEMIENNNRKPSPKSDSKKPEKKKVSFASSEQPVQIPIPINTPIPTFGRQIILEQIQRPRTPFNNGSRVEEIEELEEVEEAEEVEEDQVEDVEDEKHEETEEDLDAEIEEELNELN